MFWLEKKQEKTNLCKIIFISAGVALCVLSVAAILYKLYMKRCCTRYCCDEMYDDDDCCDEDCDCNCDCGCEDEPVGEAEADKE